MHILLDIKKLLQRLLSITVTSGFSMMPSRLLTILLVLLFAILPRQEVAADDGNHNRNWEDGFASWDEFGHDNSDNCNIPKLTVEEWEMGRYWEGNVPVIVKNVTGGWAANHNWKLSEMLERYPDAQATMGDATLIGRKGPDDLKSILTQTTIKVREEKGDIFDLLLPICRHP